MSGKTGSAARSGGSHAPEPVSEWWKLVNPDWTEADSQMFEAVVEGLKERHASSKGWSMLSEDEWKGPLCCWVMPADCWIPTAVCCFRSFCTKIVHPLTFTDTDSLKKLTDTQQAYEEPRLMPIAVERGIAVQRRYDVQIADKDIDSACFYPGKAAGEMPSVQLAEDGAVSTCALISAENLPQIDRSKVSNATHWKHYAAKFFDLHGYKDKDPEFEARVTNKSGARLNEHIFTDVCNMFGMIICHVNADFNELSGRAPDTEAEYVIMGTDMLYEAAPSKATKGKGRAKEFNVGGMVKIAAFPIEFFTPAYGDSEEEGDEDSSVQQYSMYHFFDRFWNAMKDVDDSESDDGVAFKTTEDFDTPLHLTPGMLIEKAKAGKLAFDDRSNKIRESVMGPNGHSKWWTPLANSSWQFDEERSEDTSDFAHVAKLLETANALNACFDGESGTALLSEIATLKQQRSTQADSFISTVTAPNIQDFIENGDVNTDKYNEVVQAYAQQVRSEYKQTTASTKKRKLQAEELLNKLGELWNKVESLVADVKPTLDPNANQVTQDKDGEKTL